MCRIFLIQNKIKNEILQTKIYASMLDFCFNVDKNSLETIYIYIYKESKIENKYKTYFLKKFLVRN